MAAPYVPNTAYMFWENVCNGDAVGFGYYAEFLTPPYDQADIDNLADIGDDWYSANMAPLQSVSCVYQGCRVRGVNSALDLEAFDFSGATPGGSANAPLPNNVSFAIKHSTGFTGRSGRGRSYMVGLPNNINTPDEDLVIVTYANAVIAAFELLDVALDSGGWDAVIVSRYTLGALRPTPITIPIIDHSVTDFVLDTRRARIH